MITYHRLTENNIDLTSAIAGHTADKSIVYKIVQGEPMYLGYFLPENFDCRENYPTFLMIHGGGWSTHKVFHGQEHWAGDYLGYLARYYAQKGFVAVSMDYRLIRKNGQEPEYGILECYEDCCDAVDYVIDHAADYGVDVDNMFLLGESAGGYLAGGLITFHDDRRYRFKRAFLVNAITDLHDEKWSWVICSQKRKILSPLHQVDRDTCEVILMHGEEDTTVDPKQSGSFYDRLQSLGITSELHIMKETRHAFLLAEYYQDIRACKLAIQIINEVLDVQI